ncbi:hypothetical protein VKT23_015283 [Stygiomarasmius scandens]|uniref:Acetoacetate decarboxylase n=1 Tax=Marasmiellus scandens TaxID=2682957 RepID=A0ABR1J2E7_9AGAR
MRTNWFLSLIIFSVISLQLAWGQDIPSAPAPWSLEVSDAWIFVLPTTLSTAFLPKGFADPVEEEVLRSEGAMIPDIGLMMLVRYSSSPVGPYDEMVYIPGRWAYENGDSGFRITRMYVNTSVSTFNGRKNWNIPKHTVNFDFQTSDLGVTTVSVSSPGSDTPFFSAKFLPTLAPIPVEINSTILTGDYLNLIQPPLPSGNLTAFPEEVATDTWKQLVLNVKSKTVTANAVVGNLPGGKLGDGIGYPDVFPALPIGVRVSGVLNFPVANESDSF